MVLMAVVNAKFQFILVILVRMELFLIKECLQTLNCVDSFKRKHCMSLEGTAYQQIPM